MNYKNYKVSQKQLDTVADYLGTVSDTHGLKSLQSLVWDGGCGPDVQTFIKGVGERIAAIKDFSGNSLLGHGKLPVADLELDVSHQLLGSSIKLLTKLVEAEEKPAADLAAMSRADSTTYVQDYGEVRPDEMADVLQHRAERARVASDLMQQFVNMKGPSRSAVANEAMQKSFSVARKASAQKNQNYGSGFSSRRSQVYCGADLEKLIPENATAR